MYDTGHNVPHSVMTTRRLAELGTWQHIHTCWGGATLRAWPRDPVTCHVSPQFSMNILCPGCAGNGAWRRPRTSWALSSLQNLLHPLLTITSTGRCCDHCSGHQLWAAQMAAQCCMEVAQK